MLEALTAGKKPVHVWLLSDCCLPKILPFLVFSKDDGQLCSTSNKKYLGFNKFWTTHASGCGLKNSKEMHLRVDFKIANKCKCVLLINSKLPRDWYLRKWIKFFNEYCCFCNWLNIIELEIQSYFLLNETLQSKEYAQIRTVENKKAVKLFPWP